MAPDGPRDAGRLDVGDGHTLHWERWGVPDGAPAVVLHGGPGSGCPPSWTRFFDLRRQQVVLFDQRGCGRSTPRADAPGADLSTNTTHHLVADVERLRAHLDVDRWLVLGASWGSTLGLAYAQAHPGRVTGLVLFAVVTTSRAEVAWVTEGIGRVFPEAWEQFAAGAGPHRPGERLVDAYARLLDDPDADVRARAARDWCAWEDTHVALLDRDHHDPRYDDPAFRMTFARLVTHYWRHAAWLDEGALLRGAERLAGIPGALVHGRADVSSPLDVPWSLARAWPDAALVVVDDAGHGGHVEVDAAVRAAVRRLGT